MSLPEIKLNEKNIQACFQYNADTGEWVAETITGDFLLDVDNPRIKTQDGSLKMALDLGYSIDGSLQDLVFKIDNQIMAIKPVAQRTDLIPLNLAINECAIVTNDPNFRTLVWVNRDNIGKNFFYTIKSLQSSISNWMFNEVARKLNKLDTAKIESDILNLNIEVMNIDTRVTTTENNINDLDNEVLDINAKLMDNTAEIDILKNSVSTLQTDVVAIADRVSSNENNIEKLQEKTAGITRDENIDTTIFNDDLTLNKKLEVVEKSTLHDIEIKGNVIGELKDSKGFKWEKIIRGKPKTLQMGYSDVEVLVYPNGDCVVTGCLTETTNQNVDAGALSSVINKGYPCLLNTIKYMSLNDITEAGVRFITTCNSSDVFFIKVIYRNTTTTTQDIQTTRLYFTIKATKTDLSDIDII